MKQKITPHLWFNDNAADAIALYTSIFPDSRIVTHNVLHNTGPNRDQSVDVFVFSLAGQEFKCLASRQAFE